MSKLESEILLDLEKLQIPKVKKTRKSKKKVEFAEEPIEPAEISTEEELQELEYYRDQLANLSVHNPEVLTRPINYENQQIINEMTIDELKQRCLLGQRASCSKLDDSVTQNIITITNQLTGSLLGCIEELEQSTQQDKLLHATTKEYLSLNILDAISTEIKVLGLYASHVASSFYKSRKNKIVEIVEAENIEK